MCIQLPMFCCKLHFSNTCAGDLEYFWAIDTTVAFSTSFFVKLLSDVPNDEYA